MYTNHRVFDLRCHEHFANISCDHNPIHMDALAARRTTAGAPIVHGIHSLIWILECYSRSDLYESGAKCLKATFLQPIYVGDEVTLTISQSTQTVVRARIMVGTVDVVVASIGFDQLQQTEISTEKTLSVPMTPPDTPNDLSLPQMDGLSGCLSFGPMTSQIDMLFPTAVRAFGRPLIRALACSSCLVGMVVPGLHSLFLGLEVSLSENSTAPAEAIQFTASSVSTRFRLVRIGISAQGLRGTLETINRMPPVRQASMDYIMTLVSRDEFRNSSALIVGGSRGLGELTGKLIAAGGGHVVITYATGKTDADALAEEIRSVGANCAAVAYDVHRPAYEQLAALDVIPTHIYFFATPPIFRRNSSFFDSKRFAEFNSFYVTAFYELVTTCVRLRPEGIRVFYPSSTSIDARPAGMTEYTMSKAAAEVLCSDISRSLPGVEVLTRRLPRLPTDQTSSVVQVKTADPIEVILPIVRDMYRSSTELKG